MTPDVLALPRTQRPGWIYVARTLLREYPTKSVSVGWNGRELRHHDYSAEPTEFYGWKVGRTTNLPQRAIDLVGSCRDLTFVAIAPGTHKDEVAIHREGIGERAYGGACGRGWGCSREWYLDTAQFRAWLNAFPAVWRGEIHCAVTARDGVRPRYSREVAALWRDLHGGAW